ncbi:hypothetical protein AXG93_2396s1300 [Marchantia polymorpha subsp. ruderalis]|uniref:Uncharacterized protein n=1 Tax=Marchantia polymorpha subsp. ruderalis TaxID=1480154 RepID=A0A176VCZ3_MARPO|nr:hypothetical protein AXG93_2396s1300 [Marchantia polymorpha subsp. ruderalis]
MSKSESLMHLDWYWVAPYARPAVASSTAKVAAMAYLVFMVSEEFEVPGKIGVEEDSDAQLERAECLLNAGELGNDEIEVAVAAIYKWRDRVPEDNLCLRLKPLLQIDSGLSEGPMQREYNVYEELNE